MSHETRSVEAIAVRLGTAFHAAQPLGAQSDPSSDEIISKSIPNFALEARFGLGGFATCRRGIYKPTWFSHL